VPQGGKGLALEVVYAIDSLVSGGAQRQAVELARHLHLHHGVGVTFLVYRGEDFFSERLRSADVPVVRLDRRGRYDIRFPWRVREWLRDHPVDIVHAFLRRPSLWYFLGVRAMPIEARPAFIAGERSDFGMASALSDWSCRIAYPRADAVTANSAGAAKQIQLRFGVPQERIHYLPNGIDLVAWDAAADGPAPIALEADAFHLALIGQLRPEKNHTVVLDALVELGPERICEWRVWFVGDAAVVPGYTDSLRREIGRRGLSRIVRIVPPVTRVGALMRHLDGLLLPSLFEGFPNVVLEAMASRLPVVAFPVGDVPSMIGSSQAEFLVDPPSAGSLARTLVRLQGLGPSGRKTMGERARRIVEERYSIEAVAERHLALYRSLRARTVNRR